MRAKSDMPLSLVVVALMALAQLVVVGPALWSGDAAAAPPSPTSWTRYAGNPVVQRGPSGSYDDDSVLWAASLVDTGTEFYLYYNAVAQRGTTGLATSTDCRTWTKYSGNPILSGSCCPGVLKDGSTWKMWFSDGSGMGYATSSDGKSWTKAATGIMAYGSSSAWDRSFWSLCVLKDTSEYKLYYTGCGPSNQQIGLATSPDGLTWTKYAQNPILRPVTGTFESVTVQFPWVMKEGNEYRMWYGGHDGAHTAVAYATSNDGISWSRHAGNPVLGYNNTQDANPSAPLVVLRNNTLEMIYSAYSTSWSADLRLAESFGTTPSSPILLSPQNDQWTNDSTPTFSWRFGVPSDQSSFQLQLDAAADFTTPVYDSGKQATNQTSLTLQSPAADGTYYWRVKAWDLGNVASGWSPPWKLKIDSTPPLNPSGLASTSHALGVWSKDNTVDAGWTLPPGGGDISGYAGFGTIWDTSPYSVPELFDQQDPVATSSTSHPAVDTDSLYFHIRARDRAGNWATGAAHLGPFAVDATPPLNPARIFSASHTPQQWSNDSTMDMNWTEPEAGLSGADGFAYLWDRQSYTLPQTVLNVSADVLAVSSEPLSDGNDWYFHLRTKDRSGNWALNAAHSGPYWIDSTAPSILEATVNGGAEYATCQTVRLILRADDPAGGSGLSQMRWKFNEDDWGRWETYFESSVLDLASGDGTYVIRLQVRDLANNTSPVASATIRLDRMSPPEALLSINNGDRFTNSTAVLLGVTAQDPPPGSGIWNMSLSYDGRNWDPWVRFCESFPLDLPPGDGNKTVQVRLRDHAGNIGPASSATIILDTKAPVSFIPMLRDVVDDLAFDVNWTASDATSGVATFDLQYQDNNGSWTDWFTGTCQTGARFTGQDNHTYRFRVLARDSAGNREAAFKAVSNQVRIELPSPLVSIGKPASGTIVRGKYTASGLSGHPRTDLSVVLVEVRIDDGPWKPARGTQSWSYSFDSSRLDNGKHILTVRSYDGRRHSAETAMDFQVSNEKGLSLEGMPLLLLVLVIVLAAAGIGAGLYISRRRNRALQPSVPAAYRPEPSPPLPPVPPPRPAASHPPASPPPPVASMPVQPAGPLIVERTVSVKDLDMETELPGGPMAMTPPAPEDAPPDAPRKPRTAEDERSMRESRVLQALSSLPRGLPSTLWGLDMEELAARVVGAERKDSPDGDLLVRINNRWYYGDETNIGLFMQEHRK